MQILPIPQIVDGSPVIDIKPYIPAYDSVYEHHVCVYLYSYILFVMFSHLLPMDLFLNHPDTRSHTHARTYIYITYSPTLIPSPPNLVCLYLQIPDGVEVRIAPWLQRPPVPPLGVEFTAQADQHLAECGACESVGLSRAVRSEQA